MLNSTPPTGDAKHEPTYNYKRDKSHFDDTDCVELTPTAHAAANISVFLDSFSKIP